MNQHSIFMNQHSISDHFFAPRNVGDAHEPSFAGRAASFRCGASCRFSIQIGESHDIIEAKFRAAGCNVLVACLSRLTEIVEKRTTADAALIGQDQNVLLDYFGDLDSDRIHCTTLAREALLRAVRAYSDAARSEWIGDEALICTCFCVSERTIEETIHDRGLRSVAEVTRACYAGGGCGSCHHLIQEMIDSSEVRQPCAAFRSPFADD